MPLVAELVARAQASGQLRPDVSPLDMPVIAMTLAAAIDYTGHANPEVWRRMAAFVLDGLRTSRDEPSPLPSEPLTAEEFVAAMAGRKPVRS